MGEKKIDDMREPDFDELSHNKTYVSDVLQDNDGFLALFMSTHDVINCSEPDLEAVPECYGEMSIDCNVVHSIVVK